MNRLGRTLAVGVLGVVASLLGPSVPAAEGQAGAKAARPLQMEFSVVEQEADGSRHVIASPKVLTRDGDLATVRVRTQSGHGLNLVVSPKKLADGLVKLNVNCRSWREESDGAGRKRLKSREVQSKVVVAEGRRIELKSGGDQRMTLELEIREL